MSDIDPEEYLILIIKRKHLEGERSLKYSPHVILEHQKGRVHTLKDGFFGTVHQPFSQALKSFFRDFFGNEATEDVTIPAKEKNDPFYLLR
jgi:hypothetical protein